MKFGASMFFTDYSMGAAELAVALEERGFDIVWAPEHSHIPLSRKSDFIMGGELPKRYYDVMDPFVTLTAAALATKTLKVATGVCLIAQRDPIQTAKLVASIDQVSGGRFVFGVGNGWNRDEMENHGTDFASRHKRARENIEAMKAIWTQSKAEYHGEFVNFDPMMAWPKPVQEKNPTPLVELVPRFRQMCAEAGRDADRMDISIGGQQPDADLVKRYRDAGINRVSASLPSEKADTILPMLDQWVPVMRAVNG